MLSGVLTRRRAVAVNIAIMRTFVRMRRLIQPYRDLAHQLDLLEQKYDAPFKAVFEAIRKLMEPPVRRQKRRTGFHP